MNIAKKSETKESIKNYFETPKNLGKYAQVLKHEARRYRNINKRQVKCAQHRKQNRLFKRCGGCIKLFNLARKRQAIAQRVLKLDGRFFNKKLKQDNQFTTRDLTDIFQLGLDFANTYKRKEACPIWKHMECIKQKDEKSLEEAGVSEGKGEPMQDDSRSWVGAVLVLFICFHLYLIAFY